MIQDSRLRRPSRLEIVGQVTARDSVMETGDAIAVVAACIALLAIVPSVLSWRAAREQTGLARDAAKDAAAEATTAKEHAESAGRTAAAAESQAQAAHHHAEIAEKHVDAVREQAQAMDEHVDVARQHVAAAVEQARVAARTAGAAEGSRAAQVAGLLFEIDRALRDFDDVHAALQPGGPGWFGPGDERRREKWIPVERYMGAFERVQAVMELGLVEAELIESLYGYRIGNLVADPVIYRYKLVENADGWRRFIELWRVLDAAHRKRTKRPLAQRGPPQRVA
jgi:hypothetical protein